MGKRSAMWWLAAVLLGCHGAPPAAPVPKPPSVDASPPAPDQGPRITASTPTLSLEPTPAPQGQLAARVRYVRRPAQAGPRVVELRLRVGAGLHFLRAAAGESAIRAGKNLTVRTQPGGQVRLIFLSPVNVNRLDSGVLATLFFAPAGVGPRSVTLSQETPWFAPAAANVGLVRPPVIALSL